MARRGCFIFAAVLSGLSLLILVLISPRMAVTSAAVPGIIISEIAWMGTAADPYHEWIELYNPSTNGIDVTDWLLTDLSDINVILSGTIPPKGFYLLERTQMAIRDIEADQFFKGSLLDSGESLYLRDNSAQQVDSVNNAGENWPAGTGQPDFRSMERLTQDKTTGDETWITNDGVTRNGLDASSKPINGTPGQPNSSWVIASSQIDLVLRKTGPITVTAGDFIRYSLLATNTGVISATNTLLMDNLPGGTTFVSDNGQYSHEISGLGQITWHLGTLAPGTQASIELTVSTELGFIGTITNVSEISSSLYEEDTNNNHAAVSTQILADSGPRILIQSVHWSGYEVNQNDEAVQLVNVGNQPVDLTGWGLTDNESTAIFPESAPLAPAGKLWVSQNGTAFTRQFGFSPDFEINNSQSQIPDLIGNAPRFSDEGDEVVIVNEKGQVHDVLVYKGGNNNQSGWHGPALEPYRLQGVFGERGQILFRSLNEATGLPLSDTNTAHDWAQSENSGLLDRLVQYPGWDLDAFFFPATITGSATISVGISPDNALDLLLPVIKQARESIKIETLTFRSWQVASELIAAAERGVSVTVLLEGDPPGGIDDQEKLICQSLTSAGATCWFMISDESQRIFDRYRYLHAKFVIIDSRIVIISTENLSPDSLPDDEKSDGTLGRRGLLIATDSELIVERINSIWRRDFDPDNHVDLLIWNAPHPKYGDPALGTIPITLTGGSGYLVHYDEPLTITGTFWSQVYQSPENSLRATMGILHLLNNSGQGDTILVEQLAERPHWGPSDSNATDDPNPRLEAYLAAARRGASVQILLDSFFDDSQDPTSNLATCLYVKQVAISESIDIRCIRANPAGLGIHNKMILIELNGQGYIYVGSVNGTELSSKGNREVALLIKSDELFNLLASLFYADWPNRVYFPIFLHRYIGPAAYPLISEIYYNPPGTIEDDEFIEIANPTLLPLELSQFSVGDASDREDFEDVRLFPSDTILKPHETIIIAATASGFFDQFGFNPDFEIVESNGSVPNLIDDPSWGDPAAILRLSNDGDEIYLRDSDGQIIDAVAYGSGNVSGQTSCPLTTTSGHSLERFPFWRDTDDCSADFRDWPFPNPGVLP